MTTLINITHEKQTRTETERRGKQPTETALQTTNQAPSTTYTRLTKEQ